VLAGAIPDADRIVDFPLSEVKRLTGLELPDYEIKLILRELGFWVSGNDKLVKVAVPSWRPDIDGKADLVEEVVRIAGLDRVPAVPFPREAATVAKPVLTLLQRRTMLARRALAARGLVEAVTWSFIAQAEAACFGGGQPALALANPIAADLSDMRPSLLPGLVKAAQRNADRGFIDGALFEVGQVFAGDRPQDQSTSAAAIRRGLAKATGVGRHWSLAATPADAFDAKADALALLEALGVPTGGLQVVSGAPDWFHPGRSGTLQFGPKGVVGCFGELHPRALEALDAKGPLAAFEICLDRLPMPKAKPTKVKPKLVLSDFQPVSRDFAFIVERSVAAADILRAAQGAERALIAGVEVFDLYEGPGIPEGKKSVAVAVTLQPMDKTLTDAQIDAVAGKIVAEVVRKTGATLRG
jgi:phenylalanyl-tRNA synthetase beta chain